MLCTIDHFPRSSLLKAVVVLASLAGLLRTIATISTSRRHESHRHILPNLIRDCAAPANASGTGRIPNIVHQTWKTSDVSTYPIPASRDAWKAQLASLPFQVTLWSDDDIRTLVRDEYAWLLPTYDGYAHDIQRADLARLVIAHARGGIYADLDVYPVDARAIVCLQRLGLQAIFASTSGNQGASNHFFMAEKGSDLLMRALREAERRAAAATWFLVLPYLRVFWSTGPLMVMSVAREYTFGREAAVLGVIDQAYGNSIFHHAAGRSWQGLDGRFLNYVGDHGPLLLVAVLAPPVAATLVVIVYVVASRSRAKAR
ncbi:uncharacterized protein UV8b_03269 [Ustilaginoidea virens]|uniref:Uncharacterized protein n=1 Tax=Ustilaginoidea virens TaxID=1159556 RepID=A0A063BTS4_USTVR|nr:uncharacterized protein UV8b_03269 [Ustilaginoidea virens]QUC19028.1 hypothetical protein UV8b_03269 [Ustilaginoidea virens]GAO18829.1 hypothetical protein UVI_02029900 [Ustilaginoidea virens]